MMRWRRRRKQRERTNFIRKIIFARFRQDGGADQMRRRQQQQQRNETKRSERFPIPLILREKKEEGDEYTRAYVRTFSARRALSSAIRCCRSRASRSASALSSSPAPAFRSSFRRDDDDDKSAATAVDDDVAVAVEFSFRRCRCCRRCVHRRDAGART